MPKITVSVVRRPDGSRKGRNCKEVVLLGPAVVDVPQTSTHNAPPPLGGYKFAFWWVKGSNGTFVSFNPAVTITSTTDIVAKTWFVAANPLAPNGNYVFVDAFDVDTGCFLDDDFVTVTDNNQANAQLTQNANTNGLVPTAANRLIEAASTVGAVAFDKWVCVTGMEQITAATLTALPGANAEAIAFYKGGPPQPPGLGLRDLGRFFAEQTWVSWGVTVDGGGPTGGGPVPPWTPLTLNLAAGLALAEAALKLHPRLRAEALKTAAKQISMSAEEIGKAIAAAAEGSKE